MQEFISSYKWQIINNNKERSIDLEKDKGDLVFSEF